MKTRPLPITLRSDHTTRTQIRRENNIAIYQCIHDNAPDHTHWEVIKIRSSKPHPNDKNTDNVSLVEHYPPSESWGQLAWTCTSAPAAKARFTYLLNLQDTPTY